VSNEQKRTPSDYFGDFAHWVVYKDYIDEFNLFFFLCYSRESVFPYMLDKLDARLAVHVGSFIAWSMESLLTVR